MIFIRTFLFITITFILAISTPQASVNHSGAELLEIENESLITELYNSANLGIEGLSYDAFKKAMIGYLNLINNKLIKNTRVITILDFNQPSTAKRFYIIDVKTGHLLLKTYVSHGVNTGLLYAENFSNQVNSKKSSLGMYKASETYIGKYGLSLKLDGLEKDINDNARERAIVLHPAKYVSEQFISQNGYIGRSFGCPAVPYTMHKKVINYIKGGSLLFIYSIQNQKDNTPLNQLPDNTIELLGKYTTIPPQKISNNQ